MISNLEKDLIQLNESSYSHLYTSCPCKMSIKKFKEQPNSGPYKDERRAILFKSYDTFYFYLPKPAKFVLHPAAFVEITSTPVAQFRVI